jgi:hypothetical protein
MWSRLIIGRQNMIKLIYLHFSSILICYLKYFNIIELNIEAIIVYFIIVIIYKIIENLFS